MNCELGVVDFEYNRLKPGEITGWDEYNITGKAYGIDNYILRLHIRPPINATYIKPFYGIDKISLLLPREFINESMQFYNTNYLTLNHVGQYTKLHFHAECFFFNEEYRTIKDNIDYYLEYLIEHGFLHVPISYENERTGKTYNNKSKQWYRKLPENLNDVFNIIVDNIKISEIEIFFDFKRNIFKYFDRSDYINVSKTLYSKDYVYRKNYKQKSLICIYDKAKALGIENNLFRLEYRLTGKYLKKHNKINSTHIYVQRYSLCSFDYSVDDFIKMNEKYIGVLSNKLLSYDYDFLNIVGNSHLFRILTEFRHLKRYREDKV